MKNDKKEKKMEKEKYVTKDKIKKQEKKAVNEKRIDKAISLLILAVVLGVVLFAGYIVHDKRVFENGFKIRKGEPFLNTRELTLKPVDRVEDVKYLVRKDNGEVVRKAPFNPLTLYGQKDKDGDLKLDDAEFAVDEEYSKLKKVTKKENVNPKEVMTEENIKKSQSIILEKIRKAGFTDFKYHKDPKTGNIVLSLNDETEEESKQLEKLKRVVSNRGLFQVMDSKTGKEYLNNSHLKKVTTFTHPQAGIVIEISFNDEGKEILKDITGKYKVRDLTEQEKKEQQKKLKSQKGKKPVKPINKKSAILFVTVDGNPITIGVFPEPIENGKITIPVAKDLDRLTLDQLREAQAEADEIAMMIRTGAEPIKYEIAQEVRLLPKMTEKDLKLFMYAGLAILVLSFILLTAKYKSKGIYAWFLSFVYTATMISLVQYTNIAITIPSILAIFVLYLAQVIYSVYCVKDLKLEKEKAITQNMLLIFKNTIIIILAAIVLCFAKTEKLQSFGLMILYGELLFIIYNLIFAKKTLE